MKLWEDDFPFGTSTRLVLHQSSGVPIHQVRPWGTFLSNMGLETQKKTYGKIEVVCLLALKIYWVYKLYI